LAVSAMSLGQSHHCKPMTNTSTRKPRNGSD
jgi:hypothetical protein